MGMQHDSGSITVGYDVLRQVIDEVIRRLDPNLVDRERATLVEWYVISTVSRAERLEIQRAHDREYVPLIERVPSVGRER